MDNFQKTLIFSILGVITPLNIHGRSYRECYNFQIRFGKSEKNLDNQKNNPYLCAQIRSEI
jgi:hypothetical protein